MLRDGSELAEEEPVVILDRVVPPPEVLDEQRQRGPLSAALAEVHLDPSLDRDEVSRTQALIKAEGLALAAQDAADPRTGEIAVPVGKQTAVASSVSVDGLGALVCTVDHPDLPEVYPEGHPAAGVPVNPFRFVNPPVTVSNLIDGAEMEDPEAAFKNAVSKAVRSALEAFK